MPVKKKRNGNVYCAPCNRMFPNPQGLGAHNKWQHSGKNGKLLNQIKAENEIKEGFDFNRDKETPKIFQSSKGFYIMNGHDSLIKAKIIKIPE